MITKLDLIFVILFHISNGNFRCLTNADDTRYIVRSGTALTFLCTTMNERKNLNTFTDIHDSDAFWSVNLVTAGGKHINVHLIHINWYMSESLYRIRME